MPHSHQLGTRNLVAGFTSLLALCLQSLWCSPKVFCADEFDQHYQIDCFEGGKYQGGIVGALNGLLRIEDGGVSQKDVPRHIVSSAYYAFPIRDGQICNMRHYYNQTRLSDRKENGYWSAKGNLIELADDAKTEKGSWDVFSVDDLEHPLRGRIRAQKVYIRYTSSAGEKLWVVRGQESGAYRKDASNVRLTNLELHPQNKLMLYVSRYEPAAP